MAAPPSDLKISQQARELHFRSIVVDTHVDTTQRLLEAGFDLGERHANGSVDIPRLRDGGISAVFFAIWVPGTVTGREAVKRALAQIEAVRREVSSHPDDLILARSAEEIRHARADGRIAILIGIEGGHMIDCNLDVLRGFASRGAAYMTLTHMRNTEWADASTDPPRHNGLSPLGKEVIAEMNRLGMIVDVSHVSDKAVLDVLETSEAAVFASHSSCRALCDSPRNLPDDLIRAIAAKGGLVHINFHVGFLSQEFIDFESAHPEIEREVEVEAKRRAGENGARELVEWDRIVREFAGEGKLPRVKWTLIIDHLRRAADIAGIDHVGFGSDFDGACMPFGMEDAAKFPRLTEALLREGLGESDIQKILGGNLLRLMEDVEAAAHRGKGSG
ncbi:MAG: dipeptidase [Acidobacteriota bacterium]|nr:dipeptidase [Acidobacteriota bacterium]